MNIIDYAKTNLKIFDEIPFNEVDSLILSWLSYLRIPSIISDNEEFELLDLFNALYFDEMLERIGDKESTLQLLTSLVSNPRYRRIKMSHYADHIDMKEEMQFSAITFKINNDLHYIAYRGTDSTFVGWKEDFNMTFQYPVPAQLEAAKYFKDVSSAISSQFILGGHSKGGNLAICSSLLNPDLNSRIDSIYSHDGPGFLSEVVKLPQYKAISSKIKKTVPQSSIIGMLLEQSGYDIIESNQRSIWQHNPFSWNIEDNHLCHLNTLTKDAIYVDETIQTWLKSISKEDRERFIDTIYRLVENIDATTFSELNKQKEINYPIIYETMKNTDQDTKDFMAKILSSLAKTSLQVLPNHIFKN